MRRAWEVGVTVSRPSDMASFRSALNAFADHVRRPRGVEFHRMSGEGTSGEVLVGDISRLRPAGLPAPIRATRTPK